MSFRPKVALSQDFLAQLPKLPAAVQGKVMKWTVRFQADPTAPGINYETIKAARDPNLRSIRIDGDWRGIVFKPPRGDVYVLLYVGHHDSAYRWAENKKLTINPVTGAMQLISLEHVVEPAPAPAPQGGGEEGMALLYAGLSNTQLMSLGVPEDMLDAVRAVDSEEALDALQPHLPSEAYEGLFLVAAGDTVEQVLQSRATRVDAKVDTEDFGKALETAESRSRFYVVEDEEALRAVMNAPLAQWRVFLHPTQYRLARGNRNGPVRVLGGAGTGKTVLAMHRAKWLAENATPEGKKVLFTTFTRNLAIDIEQNLKTLCSRETMEKIEVKNLDAWVAGFMRAHRIEHRIVYDRSQDGALQAWQAAMTMTDPKLDLPDEFYEDELEQVVLAQGVTTLDQYRTVRRVGRGMVLTRAMRDAIWPVFEEYRGQLASRRLKEVDDAYREIAEMIEADPQGRPDYSAIVVDETQDFGPQALKLLRAMIPPGTNDLFFVGDGHQRIYNRNRAVMSRCGIDIRGRAHKLYLNYRTTEEIRRQAVALLEGCEIDDLDGGLDENKRYKSLSHGPSPEICLASGLDEAATLAAGFVRRWLEQCKDVDDLSFCVVSHSNKYRDALGARFNAEGMKTITISAQGSYDEGRNVVHLATMHRAKGLEFDCVVVVAPKDYLGPAEKTLAHRRLLYVALTRAKRGAMLVQIP